MDVAALCNVSGGLGPRQAGVKECSGGVSFLARGGEGIHHQTGAAAGDVCHHGSTAMQLGDRAQIDRKRETDLLAFT